MNDLEETILQASAATAELYHTNLLRVQAKELLSESILHLSSHTGEHSEEVKWADQVRTYLDTVKQIINGMGECILSPDTAILSSTQDVDNNQKDTSTLENERFWIQLQSDLSHKHIQSKEKKSSDLLWEFPFPGGSSLKIHPVYSYAVNGAGFTTKASNAHVLPTVDLAVLIPVDTSIEDDKEFINETDYMNGRYFDKRNILALHIAKYLSQKKQRKSIGSVHIQNQLDGDYRRISLLLSPPPTSSSHTSESQPTKKQKLDKDKTKETKKSPIRYQVRLILGTTCDMRSSEEMNVGWIPRARLFPNRINNKFSPELKKTLVGSSDAPPTPMYTSSLVEDWHHVQNTELLAHTAQWAGRSFTESWTLVKIWCLQRGFLRGEDTLSDTHIGLTLTYLYRSKLISHRMDCIQIFTIWLKFIADTNWLGEYDTSKAMDPVGKDTIRFSESEGYRNASSSEYRQNKVAVVMPMNMTVSEKQTVIDCIQNRIYLSDYKETKARLTKNQGQASGEKVPPTLLECYKVVFEGPVFLDSTMTLNYFSRLSSAFMRVLQMEARKSLNCIHTTSLSNQTLSANSAGFDPFRHLFLEHLRFWRSHDMYIKVRIDDINFPKQAKAIWGSDAYDVGAYESIKRGLMNTLRLALSDRVYCLRVLTTGNGEISEKSIAQQRANLVGDFGMNILVGTDQSQAIPIRHSNENKHSFRGYAFGETVSPVSRGQFPNDYIVIGFNVNPNTCHRIIDRGPPAEDGSATASFVQLWGEQKAQLRRFKDGAIVHAALWNQIEDAERNTTHYEGDGKAGGLVERIARHIIRIHFSKSVEKEKTECALRDMQSLVCGAVNDHKSDDVYFYDPTALFKEIMVSFDLLSSFLRENSKSPTNSSKLGIPLPIDAVEPLSSSLRYSDLFPPLPHPSLGSTHSGTKKTRTAGAIMGEPISIQIRFEASSDWPNEENALEAAKCAMLIQLAKGLEKMKEEGQQDSQFLGGPIHVFDDHVEIGFRGFVWKILLRVEHEMKILETAQSTTLDHVHRYQLLYRHHVLSLRHHFAMHGILSKYPVAGPTLRLAKRWIAAHMLSGLIPFEAIELIVASLFVQPLPFHTPATISSAFMRFLHHLGTYDWLRHPLLVDLNGDLSIDDRAKIYASFESIRSTNHKGPAMYIVSSSECKVDGTEKMQMDDFLWKPVFTKSLPERVVLQRACALAKRSYDFLVEQIIEGNFSNSWMAIFQETQSSLMSFSALFRINEQLIADTSCSSMISDYSTTRNEDGELITPYTKSMERRLYGPKALQFKNYRNLEGRKESILYCWRPIESLLSMVTKRFGHLAIFFYNDLTPNVIAVLWRPSAFSACAFSAMTSEFKRPIDVDWQNDSMVVTNVDDVLREIHFMLRHAAINLKVLDRPGATRDKIIHRPGA